ncbi:MAG TPA: tRNA preQ1(34) S-adenosylmethionine ribosyltransferase-isomerase QueA [Polyangiaceae bacterium]
MKTELFTYHLPEELIAVRPPERRGDARLLVLSGASVEHRSIRDFSELVPEGSLLVLNDTRVRRARVLGARAPGGGKVELLFLRALEQASGEELWEALGRANKPLRAGTRVAAPEFEAQVVGSGAGGLLRVRVRAEGGVERWLERSGHVPIPPYLRRADEPLDGERYQTVFAERTGSVAAPTAGLHLEAGALERLRARGVEIEKLTLEIGVGTFRPVTADDLDRHEMHAESLEVSAALVSAVERARARRVPVVAVGTTVVRALESAADPGEPGRIRAVRGETRLLIQPGYAFRVVDGLLTNFHQPQSTLLALVCAFAGRDPLLAAYAEAVAARYRFLSYGDAMWIPRRA